MNKLIAPPQANDEVWTKADGTKILISQMTEQHAKNALRSLIRKARERQEAACLKMLRKHVRDLESDYKFCTDRG